MRHRSLRMQKLYRQKRIPLVKEMLAEDETGMPALCVKCGRVAADVN